MKVKVRRKAIAMWAEEFTPDMDFPIDNLPEGVRGDYSYRRPMDAYWWIDTLEGHMIVKPGDWIMTGVEGEHWAIKPEIFRETYELVEDE